MPTRASISVINASRGCTDPASLQKGVGTRMSLIKVTAEELQSTSSQLDRAAQQIQSINSGAMGQVNNLVGAGWEGAASGQFSALFQEWTKGAQQVQEALAGISQLLNSAGQAYQQTEDQIARSMRG